MNHQKAYKFLLLLCIAILFQSHLQAADRPQDQDNGQPSPSIPTTSTVTVSLDHTRALNADWKDATGSLSRADISAGLAYQTSGMHGLYRIGVEQTHFEYDSDGMLVFEEVDSVSLGLKAVTPFSWKWSSLVLSQVKMAAAEGADKGDAFSGLLGLGMNYRFASGNMLAGGLIYMNRPGKSDALFPFVTFKYDINDNLVLRMEPTPALIYDLKGDKKTFLEIGLDYSSEVFAISPGAGGSERVVYDRTIVGQLKLSHEYDNGFFTGVWVNLLSDRELTIRENNREVADQETDPTLAIGLGGGYRF